MAPGHGPGGEHDHSKTELPDYMSRRGCVSVPWDINKPECMSGFASDASLLVLSEKGLSGDFLLLWYERGLTVTWNPGKR